MIILSNNLWKCDNNLPLWAERGEDCSAEARIPGFFRVYKEVMPDLLGLQEVSVHMGELLMTMLRSDEQTKNYEYISGGDTPIIYRADKYKLLESGFYRYPEKVPGQQGSFNNFETKSYCYGVFEKRVDRGPDYNWEDVDTPYDTERIVFLSTHLWFMSSARKAGSAEAREYQIGLALAQMNEKMLQYQCPGVIVGDLNSSIGSKCLNALYADGWTDAHDLTEERDETCGFHECGQEGWAPKDPTLGFGRAIDHIMIKNFPQKRVVKMARFEEPWYDVCSDHYPAYVVLQDREQIINPQPSPIFLHYTERNTSSCFEFGEK